MSMNNKGFTLIELIATIALLAVISLISYVSITKVLEQNKINQCETLVNNIKSAAKEYVSDNRYNKDFVNSLKEGNDYKYSMELSLSELVENNYLNAIIDKDDEGNDIIKNPIDDDEPILVDNVKINIDLNENFSVKEVKSVSGIVCE